MTAKHAHLKLGLVVRGHGRHYVVEDDTAGAVSVIRAAKRAIAWLAIRCAGPRSAATRA